MSNNVSSSFYKGSPIPYSTSTLQIIHDRLSIYSTNWRCLSSYLRVKVPFVQFCLYTCITFIVESFFSIYLCLGTVLINPALCYCGMLNVSVLLVYSIPFCVSFCNSYFFLTWLRLYYNVTIEPQFFTFLHIKSVCFTHSLVSI